MPATVIPKTDQVHVEQSSGDTSLSPHTDCYIDLQCTQVKQVSGRGGGVFGISTSTLLAPGIALCTLYTEKYSATTHIIYK